MSAAAMDLEPDVEWVQTGDGRWVHAIRDVEQLRTLEVWRLRWSSSLEVWLYFPPATDRATA